MDHFMELNVFRGFFLSLIRELASNEKIKHEFISEFTFNLRVTELT